MQGYGDSASKLQYGNRLHPSGSTLQLMKGTASAAFTGNAAAQLIGWRARRGVQMDVTALPGSEHLTTKVKPSPPAPGREENRSHAQPLALIIRLKSQLQYPHPCISFSVPSIYAQHSSTEEAMGYWMWLIERFQTKGMLYHAWHLELCRLLHNWKKLNSLKFLHRKKPFDLCRQILDHGMLISFFPQQMHYRPHHRNL